ncbi:leucyl aminopeptidase [Gilvimarinus polysaccharolyticus]|uniref:leucyl aminopeptidase n=1 Tax=Gilvimarinus polysaccharolyticus TaxID=863921 RepID=UPI000673A955|nr:leucyl aminopeptidase [Gilvimarinus polysaccharolyticus]
MQFQAKSFDAASHRSPLLVVGVFSNTTLTPGAHLIDQAGKGQLSKLLTREKFTGARGTSLMLHHSVGQTAERLLIIGLGPLEKSSIEPAAINAALNALQNVAKSATYKSLSIDLTGVSVSGQASSWLASHIAQTLTTGLWQFDQLKSQKSNKLNINKITVNTDGSAATIKKSLEQGQALADGMNYARELGNLPGNICTPSYLANQARAMGRGQSKLKVSVLTEKQMQAEGMGSLLSVSAGSDEPAKLIVMEYRGAAKSQAPNVLVGKGITFDTGGISLKPGAGMDEMKFDMCGAASVFGTMKTLLALQPKINVVAIVAAAENMPSGGATKPGDIVTSMSGQTIEVLNTDAEGRLVLCDALTYSKRFKPKTVIDIATLTGACVIALGSHAHGLYSNDQAFADRLLDAGIEAGDRAWQMPLWDEYQKQLDSNFADIANIGGREAGSITAACFLSRFTKDLCWAHLDIAGTAWKSGGAKGATGRPVPLLVQYLLNNK